MRINDVEFNVSAAEIVQELVSQLRLNNIQYIQRYRDVGGDVQVCCPYHKNGMERRPSAGIRKSDGMFHCFACNEVHTLPEVISYCFGHEDDILGKFGWNWLLKNFAIIKTEERKDVELNLRRDILAIKDKLVDNKKNFVTEEELDKYRYIHPYMYERKLTDEIIELFDIGFDKDSECITFPVRDINGNCLFIARRSVKTKFFSYPQGVEKPLYGLYELSHYNDDIKTFSGLPADCSEVIVCESMIDALTCWVYGKYAVALNGLGNESQLKQLRELPCRKLILATDMDDAGKKARVRIKKNIKNKLITEYTWDINMAKDINDMTKEQFLHLEEFM